MDKTREHRSGAVRTKKGFFMQIHDMKLTTKQSISKCQRSVKTGHYLGLKTALVGPITAGLEGHVECPESGAADDDI
jgi:hypothetical protein